MSTQSVITRTGLRESTLIACSNKDLHSKPGAPWLMITTSNLPVSRERVPSGWDAHARISYPSCLSTRVYVYKSSHFSSIRSSLHTGLDIGGDFAGATAVSIDLPLTFFF